MPIVDEFGSGKSRLLESTQREAQGEFGVTCKAATCFVKSVRARPHRREVISPGDITIKI